MKGRGVGGGIGMDGSFLGDGEYGIGMCRSYWDGFGIGWWYGVWENGVMVWFSLCQIGPKSHLHLIR